MFEACKQQPSDLARKEMCRSQLQQDINRVYAGVYGTLFSILASSQKNDCVFLTVGRLYLTGSSMNGLGCRSSDADLCLVIKGNVSIAASRKLISFIARKRVTNHRHHFCSRKDTIPFKYSLSSKDCSNLCVSTYNNPL